MNKEIEHREDIEILVDSFYAKVRQDKLIGPIFEEKIQGDWLRHLEKMYSFWETVLLNNRTYRGSPFVPHANLPIGKEHFDRWLMLFKETIAENFKGKRAEEAIWRAERMAEMFHYKIQMIQNGQWIR